MAAVAVLVVCVALPQLPTARAAWRYAGGSVTQQGFVNTEITRVGGIEWSFAAGTAVQTGVVMNGDGTKGVPSATPRKTCAAAWISAKVGVMVHSLVFRALLPPVLPTSTPPPSGGSKTTSGGGFLGAGQGIAPHGTPETTPNSG